MHRPWHVVAVGPQKQCAAEGVRRGDRLDGGRGAPRPGGAARRLARRGGGGCVLLADDPARETGRHGSAGSDESGGEPAAPASTSGSPPRPWSHRHYSRPTRPSLEPLCGDAMHHKIGEGTVRVASGHLIVRSRGALLASHSGEGAAQPARRRCAQRDGPPASRPRAPFGVPRNGTIRSGLFPPETVTM